MSRTGFRVAAHVCAAVFFASAASAHARDDRQWQPHRAHQHGVADVKVTLEKAQLTAVIEGPTEVILGFEHLARTDAQKRAVQRAREQLNNQESLFALTAAARCELQGRQVTVDAASADGPETHSEFSAEYRWRCALPAELRYMDLVFLKTFPRTKELRAQVVTDTGQKTARLRSGATRLTLQP